MRGWGFFIAIFLCTPAEARPAKKNAVPKAPSIATVSGASQMPRQEFLQCVQDTVLGRTEEQCDGHGDSDYCIGFKRALEYSRLQTECRSRKAGECTSWGHQQHDQHDWTSVAAGQLVRFKDCVKQRYGNETSSGLNEARTDETFNSLLSHLEDGSPAWRLGNGGILRQTLEGLSLDDILVSSPLATEFTALELAAYKQAAAKPIPLNPLEATAADSAEASHPKQNPSQAGVSLFPLTQAQAFLDEADYHGTASLKSTREMASVEKNEISASKGITPPHAAAAEPAPIVKGESFVPSRRPKGLYSLGLDRTIFERVNDAYIRHMESMQGTEDFLREIRDIPPARDLSEVLKRGGSL
jgi:hypothetical protein